MTQLQYQGHQTSTVCLFIFVTKFFLFLFQNLYDAGQLSSIVFFLLFLNTNLCCYRSSFTKEKSENETQTQEISSASHSKRGSILEDLDFLHTPEGSATHLKNVLRNSEDIFMDYEMEVPPGEPASKHKIVFKLNSDPK